MKILFCNYEYPPLGGGGGVVMAALARSLATRHNVTVITSRALDLAPESMDGGVRVLRTPVLMRHELAVATMPSMLSFVPSALWRAMRLPDMASFDVINTHFAIPSGPAGHLLSRWYGVPNVLSVHGGDLYDPSKAMSPHRHAWLRAPIRQMLRKADAVVGQSRNTVNHVSSIYGVKRDVELVPLGIERPPRFPPASRSQFGIPEDALVLVTVGRLVPRKSTPQLVEVLSRAKLANAHLLVVGSGPDEAAIRQLAGEQGFGDRVHLLGQVTDEQKYAALSLADVFVSASQHEGFGLVFLEAMAFGLPVICYDEGGQTDFLASGETGFVVKLNDTDAFTRALRELADTPALRDRCAAHNRDKVERYFIDRCAEQYEKTFESVILAARRNPALKRDAG
ncbi:MAG: glycosyltransferase family 4 protein [Steroidobacteraceae bacterium]